MLELGFSYIFDRGANFNFSLLTQAMTLGVFPKLKVVHTGEHVEGQIYVGVVNYTLMLLCVAAVAGFNGNSTSLGNAYGKLPERQEDLEGTCSTVIWNIYCSQSLFVY
jgi:hypothetical protein